MQLYRPDLSKTKVTGMNTIALAWAPLCARHCQVMEKCTSHLIICPDPSWARLSGLLMDHYRNTRKRVILGHVRWKAAVVGWKPTGKCICVNAAGSLQWDFQKKEHLAISQLSQNSFMFNACVIDLKNKTAYNYISVVAMHIQTNFSDKTQ